MTCSARVVLAIAALLLIANFATSRAVPVPSVLGSADQAQLGAPQVPASAPVVALEGSTPPTSGAPHLIPPECSGACPRPTPRPTAAHSSVRVVVRGIATTYGPGYDGYLAWPDGPGWRLRICGPAACVTKVSNDAGPSLAGQRAGRVVDLDVTTFEQVSGQPWRRGICSVTVQVEGRG